jgi:predicted DNA repair protein MutK
VATGSLLLLIDDIASVLDDVSVLAKVATKKTAGVLGDDLALNAQQVSGVAAERELPVVLAVAKGSLINKFILVPTALAISAFAPWAITPLLMVGGAFLCYEGFEKLAHKFLHRSPDAAADKAERVRKLAAARGSGIDRAAEEKQKIKGAVRTDFVLSAEIVAITLGTAAQATFLTQVLVLSGIALAMTVGVYGFVAIIVKLDDAGLWLSQATARSAWGAFKRALGGAILWFAPWMMKALSVAGTAAMFLVGGGILTHGVAPLGHAIEGMAHSVGEAASALTWAAPLLPLLLNGLFGIAAGAVVYGVIQLASKFRPGAQKPA